MMRNGLPYPMALVPGMFYMFIVLSYILNAPIGFRLPWAASYAVAGVLTLAYGGILLKMGRKRKTSARPAGTDAE